MASETTPLLANGATPKPKKGGVVVRILICTFLISLSFSFTQVPILFVFRKMTCEEYYKVHSPEGVEGDRCNVNAINASTARSLALLGMSTTVFGTINLLITSALIKRVGVHFTLIAQTFWPSLRLCCQYFAVTVGGNAGIWIFQTTQAFTLMGGPAGYMLVLNSYVAEIVEPSQRTGVFGRLQGCTMFGGAVGFLLGGVAGDRFGITMPFKVALIMMVASTFYSGLFLPYVQPAGVVSTDSAPAKGISAMMGPTRMLLPQTWRLPDGRVKKLWGAPLLAWGVFLGTLATGYIPTLLQMYSLNSFNFSPTDNGYLMSFNLLIRGCFLSFAFPRIISMGRKWFARSSTTKSGTSTTEIHNPDEPDTGDLEAVVAPEFEQEPVSQPQAAETNEGSAFDLFFLKWSLVIDGILTLLATFTRHGWQIYLVAFILPLASGSASAAKSVMIEMCPLSEKADALSAITLVEMTALLSTITLFGGIFSGLAEVGKPQLTFVCNAAVAVVAVAFLSFCQFPPSGSERFSKEKDQDDNRNGEQIEQQEEAVPGDGK